jgi:glycosyltransferase involved in cell wall biosynthesis
MNSLKIAYVRTKFWFNLQAGGSVGHTLGIIKGLIKNGCIIKIISNERFLGIDDFDYTIIRPKIFLKRLSVLGELLFNFYARRNFIRKILEFKPDYIYFRHSFLNFFIAGICKKFKIPLILEFNGWTYKIFHTKKNLVKAFFYRRIQEPVYEKINMYNFKNSFLIVTVSRTLKNSLVNLGIEPGKILVNPNGVDIEKFNLKNMDKLKIEEIRDKFKLNNFKKVIGFIGTFGGWHGIPQLVSVITKINTEYNYPGICFLLVGDGILKKFAEEKLKNFKNVIFTGTVSYMEIEYYLAVCDILLSPHCFPPDGKEFYGSPTKLFEYMAMGKPVVASNLGQIGEILVNNKTAILVEPENIDELAKGILKLAEDSELAKNLGLEAQKEAFEKYTWVQNTKKLLLSLTADKAVPLSQKNDDI